MPRLFTALEVPPVVCERLSLFRTGLPGARWVDPALYHLTLRFVGDVDGGLAREVTAALREMRPAAPVHVSLVSLAAFGGARPRAIYAGAAAGADLLRLQAEQEKLVRRSGAEPETRKFTPHVTLARLRDVRAADVAAFLARSGPLFGLSFTATRVVLLSSREGTGGGPYVVEAEYPLGPAVPPRPADR